MFSQILLRNEGRKNMQSAQLKLHYPSYMGRFNLMRKKNPTNLICPVRIKIHEKTMILTPIENTLRACISFVIGSELKEKYSHPD